MTDLNTYTVPALKILAKQKGLSGYSDLNKGQLVQLIQGSPTSPTAPIPAAVTDGLGIPAVLKKPAPTPEQKAQTDKIIDTVANGKREYVMPNKSAVAAAAAKRQNIRKSSADSVWTAINPTKELKDLPKQAVQIVEFLRAQPNGMAFAILAEKVGFKTKQDPKRVLQYYRTDLLQKDLVRITPPGGDKK